MIGRDSGEFCIVLVSLLLRLLQVNERIFVVFGFKFRQSQEKGDQIFNPAAFTLVGYQFGTIGDSPKGYCQGPKQVNLDLSLYKTWNVSEI